MPDPTETRARVSATYAAAVRSGCCGGEEPAAAPLDGPPVSFGCGDPVAFSRIEPGDTVLDLGCGPGADLLAAAAAVGPAGRVIGVDMTDEMLERARAAVAAAGLDNVEVRRGIIEDLPVADASVDWVISNCVINLSPEKARVFAEIARVLAPGGRMLVSDIVADDLPDWVRADPGLYDSCIAGAIGEAEYVAGLEAAGLTDVAVAGRVSYDAVVFDAGRSGGTGPDRAAELAGKIWSVRVSARKPG